MNELERLDAALCATCRCTSSEEEKMQIAQSRLEALEGCIEGFILTRQFRTISVTDISMGRETLMSTEWQCHRCFKETRRRAY
ncbi:hypothetical protein RJ640_027843 [Escallonia rubra]|uniref:Uncharacterized protein n=1 Tax=Escallonia rubra TaxID=112253 RepID=A0AA88UVX6_9ASTE|nr:hypothetical protein RJ640_027843 [Escallonia rubra]